MYAFKYDDYGVIENESENNSVYERKSSFLFESLESDVNEIETDFFK